MPAEGDEPVSDSHNLRRAMDSELVSLCQSCGLCCDGSLFGRAGLSPEEVSRARKNGLHVLDNAECFEQPCRALASSGAALDGNRVCSIYGERPRSCRTFTCRLHERHRIEGGPLEPRLAAVRRVRELAEHLKAHGLRPDDFDPKRSDRRKPSAQAKAAFAELMKRLEEDFARA
jgi:uncharacterized protein